MILKYRAYIDGEFYYFDLKKIADEVGFDCQDEDACKISSWLSHGNQPDVFTGYQDSNNVDIYENDIVNYKYDDTPNIVTFDHILNRWSPFDSGDGCGCCSSPTVSLDSCKIIGNTHQNKDLLNDNTR